MLCAKNLSATVCYFRPTTVGPSQIARKNVAKENPKSLNWDHFVKWGGVIFLDLNNEDVKLLRFVITLAYTIFASASKVSMIP